MQRISSLHQHASADLIIVGGGLAGAALACSVARSLPETRIILCEAHEQEEQRFRGAHYDPRVLALSEASVNVLESLNVWPRVLQQRACPYVAMQVWDAEGNGYVEFDSAAIHAEQLGYIVENSAVVQALREQLSQYANIQWRCPAEIIGWQQQDNINKVRLADGEQIQAPLVVAADGAQSKLRELAGIRSRTWSYEQKALVASIRCQQPHHNVARQWFSHLGPLAFLPLPSPDTSPSQYCSIVWSQQTERAEELLQLSEAEFCQALTRASEAYLGSVESVSERVSIPLWQSNAVEYGIPGLILLGDSAHRIHPLAGQGANLALYDAAALANEIARARGRQVPLYHESILARYQRSRKPHNLAAMATMEGFKKLFAATHPASLLLRNYGMRGVNQLPGLKKMLIGLAAGRKFSN